MTDIKTDSCEPDTELKDDSVAVQTEQERLAQLVKDLEAKSESRLEPEQPFVIRLDGHGFSKFTKGFRKPVDARITYAMTQVTHDLVQEFNAVCGYTCSDEITLVFPAVNPKLGQGHLFSGRVQKISSLTAGYASVRFNFHLLSREYAPDEVKLKEKVQNMHAYFDARVFATPTPEDAMNAIYWRHKFDCYKNAVTNLAMCHFSAKQLHQKGSQDKLDMLASKGVKLDQFPPSMIYGTFVKKEQYEKTSTDPKKNIPVTVLRTRTCDESFKWRGSVSDRTDFVFRKYWRVLKETRPIDGAEHKETGKN